MGGFKKTHELTWVIGVIFNNFFGVIGYSLLWDQIGYWAVKIITSVLEPIPIIGFPLVKLLCAMFMWVNPH
jgi:cytochrome b6